MSHYALRGIRVVARPHAFRGLLLGAALTFALALLVPSSGRAGDFVKLGSPVASPVNLYGVTSIFDGTPNQYEAWAVGELVNDDGSIPATRKGVVLHFTGSYWTRVSLDTDVPPLRAVSTVRFVRTTTASGMGASPTWSTQGFAVGDGGVILQLDAYTDSWKEMKKYTPLGRNCTDYELANEPTNCERWTAKKLNAVVAAGPNYQEPVAVGDDGAVLQLTSYFDDLGNGQGRGMKRTWKNNMDPGFPAVGDSTINLTAMSFIDVDHGWIVGKDDSGKGRAWEMTRQLGFIELCILPAGCPGLPAGFPFGLTSATGILRSEAINPGETLKSIAWFGDENGTIYRYDNSTGAISTAYTDTAGPKDAIRSIVATRRTGGTDKNLVVNSSFAADRLEGGANRRPDGWRVYGEYWSPFNPARLMLPSALVDDPGDSKNNFTPNPADKVLASEPWQQVWQTNSLSADFRFASNTDFVWGTADTYPQQLTVGGAGFPAFPLRVDADGQPNDMVTSLLQANANPLMASRSLLFNFAGATLLGASIQGYLKVDNPGDSYQFRVLHPNGRVQMFIDNDDNSTNYCANNPSKRCTLSTDCTGSVCIDPGRSKLPSYIEGAPSTNAVASWQAGTCKNLAISQCKRGLRAGQLCSDNLFCQEGYKVCVGGESAGMVCTDTSECVNGEGAVDGICMKPLSGVLPQCVPVQSRGCFDDADCMTGTCRGGGQTCRINSDCGLFSGNPSPYICDRLGLCVAGTSIGTPCMNDINCGTGGTCDRSGKGFCQGRSNTGQTLSVVDPKDQASSLISVQFSGDGIKSKQCDGGPSDGLYCVDDSQCSGGSCKVMRSGWYPFVIRYYQENAARCSGGDPPLSFPCADDKVCVDRGIGSCVGGKWCTGGTAADSNNGSVCDEDSDCDTAHGASCTVQYPPALPPDQNPDGKPGRCSNDNSIPCWTEGECGNRTCEFPVSGNSPLVLQWKKPSDASWTSVPADHVIVNQKPTNVSTIAQNIPLSNIPGSTYRVTGRYKVEFLDDFNGYEISDPRKPESSAVAGVSVACSTTKHVVGDCGFDINTQSLNAATGVSGSRRCSKDARILCTDNTACTSQNAGTCIKAGTCSGDATLTCTNNATCIAKSAGTCRGDWIPFNLVLSKQTRDAHGKRTGVDAADTMQVVCSASVGTKIYCDDIKVTEVSSAAVAPYDTVDLFAVGDNGTLLKSSFDFSSGSPGDALALQPSPSVTPRYNSVYALDPYHVWIVGDKPVNPADPGNPADPINKERISLLSFIPGNVSGWAWVGTSQAGNDAIGWIDFNCSNLGTCQSQSSSFGVNIADATVNGVCSGNVSQTCSNDASCAAAGFGTCIAPISGSAWMGNQDPNEKIDFGPCSVNIFIDSMKGICNLGKCTTDSTRQCTMSGYSGQCMGVCALDQGFKCWKNSDCAVSCSQNPAACRSSGWLSFDRSVTGDPPLPPYKTTPSSTAPIATLNPATDTIRGWGRLQLGVCSTSGLSCFKNADCGGIDTCSYKNAMSYKVKTKVRMAYYGCDHQFGMDQSWWKEIIQATAGTPNDIDQYVKKFDGSPAYYNDGASGDACPGDGGNDPAPGFDQMMTDNAAHPYDIIMIQNPHLFATYDANGKINGGRAQQLEQFVENGGTIISEGELVTLDGAVRRVFAGAVMCQSAGGDASGTGCNFCDQGGSCSIGDSFAVLDEPFPFNVNKGDRMSKPFWTRYQGVIAKSTSYPGAGGAGSPIGTVDPTIVVPFSFAKPGWSDIGGLASWNYGKGTVHWITMASKDKNPVNNCGSSLTCIGEPQSLNTTKAFYESSFQNIIDEVGSVGEGWVKFMGQSAPPPAEPSDYLQCRDCAAGGSAVAGGGLGTGTCKICSRYTTTGTTTSTNNSCNVCSTCSTKRCTGKAVDNTPFGDCISDTDCSEGTCKPYGYDYTVSNYCFDMGTNPNCIEGARCTQCSQCSDYNVSVDYGDTKAFSGYAYSPDIGWIAFSRVRIGGKQYLQTKYGDIYSGANIGGPTTSRAPGYPGGAGSGSVMCNATYRIIASGIIQNFCTSAPIAGTATDPFALQGAPLYPLPTSSNTYTTRLGTLDLDGMTTVAPGTPNRNKFGDVIATHNGDVKLSEMAELPKTGSGKPYYALLAGKVYHVKGNLEIDKDYIFQAGTTKSTFGVSGTVSGAGTFVVDGNLTINSNFTYDAASNQFAYRTQLPSVAFIVKGEIIVNPSASELNGVFYTPNTVRVESNPPDLQLTVSGAMVASKFVFNRKYQGTSSLEPSERIIYDGRLQANPPPGITTFANGLLNIQQTTQ